MGDHGVVGTACRSTLRRLPDASLASTARSAGSATCPRHWPIPGSSPVALRTLPPRRPFVAVTRRFERRLRPCRAPADSSWFSPPLRDAALVMLIVDGNSRLLVSKLVGAFWFAVW